MSGRGRLALAAFSTIAVAAIICPWASSAPARPSDIRGRVVLRQVVHALRSGVAPASVVRAIRGGAFKAYQVASYSMFPSIRPGDRVLFCRRGCPHGGRLRRGDIVVFTSPPSARLCTPNGPIPFVSRVIGLPGDIVSVRGARTLVNGRPFVVRGPAADYTKQWARVPSGRLLVLGDNRLAACDAQKWLSPWLPRRLVIGRAIGVYLPLRRAGELRPDGGVDPLPAR